MRLAICTTTRNTPERLSTCLQAIWNSSVKPDTVIVSDDSPDPEIQQKNRQIVEQYPETTYIVGPQHGVNANRNCAVNAVSSEIDLVAFVDDDVWIDSDFIAKAIEQYTLMSPQARQETFITGISYTKDGHESVPTKLGFRGYYCPTNDVPECVHIHAAVFPRSFFTQEQWEDKIFFGQGDAILCLRALKQGYRIVYVPELRALDTSPGEGRNLRIKTIGLLTDYNIHQQAARLYIGVKRYKDLFPNYFKLVSFLTIYFGHILFFLYTKKALRALPLIMQRSHFRELW
jgi:glycosyltransferase involved in cell wall biosynthesis